MPMKNPARAVDKMDKIRKNEKEGYESEEYR